MTFLDKFNLEKIKKIDQENLADFMKKIPDQLEFIWKEKEKIKAPTVYQKVKNLVVGGMGCDRIAGELLKKIFEKKFPFSIEVVSDYKPPLFINEETLVVLLSYSGFTTEILSFFKEIIKLKKRPKIFVIGGGGDLINLAKKEKVPYYKFSGQGPSRANIGYLFFSLLLLLKNLNLLKIKDEKLLFLIKILKDFTKIVEIEKKTEENVAKYLAYRTFDRIPLIVGAEHLWSLAQRWKKEFNENAKTFAFAEEAPEFFHNTVVGIEFPWRIKDEIFFLFLESRFYQKETKKAFSIFKKILEETKIPFESVPLLGNDRLEETLTGLILGDWISFYLAILNNVNPTPVENVEIIKSQLKKI